MKKFFICLISVLILFTSCASNTKENQTSSSSQTQESKTSSPLPTEPPSAKAVDSNLSNKRVKWGVGKITDHQQPSEPSSLNEKYKKYNAQWLLDDKDKILLTFDEGYETGSTPKILDILKKHNIKAIFFVTYTFAYKNPDLIKRMIDEGHAVGNHTYSHKTMYEVDIKTATDEVMLFHNFMKEKYSYTSKYFRFPKGEFSEKTLNLVNELGYKTLFWSFAYEDWQSEKNIDRQQVVSKIMTSSHPGEIMLLHTTNTVTCDILETVIENTIKQGYSFASPDDI